MSRCVNQVQDVLFSILGLVVEAGGLQFDGDSPLPFNIHVVQILFLHISGLHQPRLLDQPVRQRGLAMVDMSNNTEISYILQIIHFSSDSVYIIHIILYAICPENDTRKYFRKSQKILETSPFLIYNERCELILF